MSQFLILDAVRGPLRGQSFSLESGRSLVVGRMPECGVPLTEDPTVSRQQCRIEYPGPDAQLVHLSQTSDTLVNGAPAARIELRPGDTIELGTGNLFRVRFDSQAAAKGVVPAAGGAPRAAPSARYSASSASCGWSMFHFEEGFEGPQILLGQLGTIAPARAVIDFQRAGVQPPDSDPPLEPLFPWLASDPQHQFSPVVVSQTGFKEFANTIGDLWGKDAVVCSGSRLDDAAFLAHWQSVSGAEGGQPGKALSVYHWPSLLKMVLTSQSASQTAPFLSKLSWILMEDPGALGKCVLFAEPSLTDQLGKLGYAPHPPAATVAPADRPATH
jgi:hypothetical protein